jgi:hypothetical protein
MFRQEYGCEFLDDISQLFASELIQAALSGEVTGLGLPTFARGVA